MSVALVTMDSAYGLRLGIGSHHHHHHHHPHRVRSPESHVVPHQDQQQGHKEDIETPLRFSVVNILRPDFGREAIDPQHENTETDRVDQWTLHVDSSPDSATQSSLSASGLESVLEQTVALEASGDEFFGAQRQGPVFFPLRADVASPEEHWSQQERKSREPGEQ